MDKNPMAANTIRTCTKSFKYRIYPTKTQAKILENWLELSRELYNAALEERREAWKRGVSVSFRMQSAQLPEIKKLRPEYKEVNAQVLQQVLHRLDRAFKNFFRRVKKGESPGYPRFKGEGRFSSIVYPQYKNGFHLASRKKLYLSGIGEVKIKLHREILGNPKTCAIKRTSSGHWYASFSCEEVPVEEWQQAHGEVGIDPGLDSFATLSDGKNEIKIENPRWLRTSENKLKQAQLELSRKKPDSRRRKKARIKVAKLHEKIARQRDDFQWKLVREIVRKNSLIAVEGTDTKELIERSNRGVSKSIQDAAWGGFLSKLSFKASNAGRTFIRTPAPWSSSTCSRCRYRLPEKLPISQRVFSCPECGLVLDRDANAARNHLRAGQALQRSTG
jgi:putative transposase